MDRSPNLIPTLTDLARRSRLVSLADLCAAFGYDESDCAALCEQLVELGLLRKTSTTLAGRSQEYYWIAAKADGAPESEADD